MKQKKILVTGAKGFVGEHWCKKLINQGHRVDAVDIKDNIKPILSSNYRYYKKSIFDFKLLDKLIKKNDYICHFAGIAEPKQYLKKTAKVIDLTILPSFEIIKLSTGYKKKLIFTSTSEIYGKNNKIPFSEEDDRVLGTTSKKRWCYSTAKAMVEHYIFANSIQNRLNFIIFRLFNVYGAGLYGRVVDEFIRKAKKNKSIYINGNGKQTRSFLHIDDCIDAFYKVVFNEKIKNEVFNVGNNKETSMNELAKIIKKMTKSKSKIIKNSNILKKLGGYEDIKRRVPNVKKIKKKINWKPVTTLEDGLKKTIKSFK